MPRRAAVAKCVHRHGSFFFVVTAPPAKAIRIPLIAPRESASISAACRFFPLNFGCQPQAGPTAIRICAKPCDVDRRMVFEFRNRAIRVVRLGSDSIQPRNPALKLLGRWLCFSEKTRELFVC